MKICVFRYICFASKSCGFEGRHVLRDSRFFQKVIRKARLRLQAGLLFPAPCRERGKGRDISFSKRDIPPFHPPRENFHCKRVARRAAMLADCTAHSAALPRLVLLYDLTYSYYPLLRSRWRLCCLTDAAHPLRVPLCPSCRSTQ